MTMTFHYFKAVNDFILCLHFTYFVFRNGSKPLFSKKFPKYEATFCIRQMPIGQEAVYRLPHITLAYCVYNVLFSKRLFALELNVPIDTFCSYKFLSQKGK